MGEYMWGITYEKPSRAEAALRQKAAESEGADYIEVNVKPGEAPGINNGRYQAWYAGPNMGTPFDEGMAERVKVKLTLLHDKHPACPTCGRPH